MTVLMDMKALKERIYNTYRNMRKRAKPKYYTRGRRKGQLFRPGLEELPFTKEQLWELALRTVGPTGVIQCPCCVDIGRPAFLIDLRNITFDHIVALACGGTWDLRNIRGCCEDCNRLKGKMSYPFFVALMSVLEKWENPADREYVHACLRTHGKAIRNFGKGKQSQEITDGGAEPAPMLNFAGHDDDDDW